MIKKFKKFSFFFFSYQPVEDPLIEPDQQVVQPIYIQLFKPSQSYPTVLSAKIAKYSIACLGKGDYKVLAKE